MQFTDSLNRLTSIDLWRRGRGYAIPISLLAALLNSAAAQAITDPPVITPATGCYSTAPTTLTITQDQGATITCTGAPGSPVTGAYSGPITLNSNETYCAAQGTLSGVTSTITTSYFQTDVNTASLSHTGLVLWYKSDFGPIPASNSYPGGGSAVARLLDMSGSGSENDATQATTTNQPSFSASGGPGSAPTVGFSGSSEYLNLTNGLGNLTGGFTLLAVIKPQSTTSSTFFVSGNSGPTDMVSLQTTGSQVVFNAYNGTTSSSLTSSSGALTQNQYQLVEVVDTGTAATLYINGTSVGTGTVQSLKNVTRSLNHMGADLTAANFWDGQIIELLAYSTGLSATNRTAAEAYLEQKYVLPVPLSPPVPVISVPTSTLTAPTQVAITAGTLATIHFTVDGTTPTSGSPSYNLPVNIGYSQTLKAISVLNGISSSVVSASYTLNSTQFPAPSTDTTPLQINLQAPTVAVPP